MPCLAIHLAVAKKYLEKHDENYDDFIIGTIAPDIDMPNIEEYIKGVSNNKASHHFGIDYRNGNLIDYMKNKVDLKAFFDSNDINTSFLRAYFLHLLCDFYFLDKCALIDKIQNLSFIDAVKIGTNDYNLITPVLIKKYDLDIPAQINDIISQRGDGNIELLDMDAIDRFIDDMSKVDLFMEKEKIINKSPNNM